MHKLLLPVSIVKLCTCVQNSSIILLLHINIVEVFPTKDVITYLIYLVTSKPCEDHRCEYGTCVPDYNDEGYSCDCDHGYEGKYCDESEYNLLNHINYIERRVFICSHLYNHIFNPIKDGCYFN